jgi:glycolate oxidase
MSISDEARQELTRLFGERVLHAGDAALAAYRKDMVSSHRWHRLPQAVVFPERTEEVQDVMKWAQRHAVPVTARGSGSGLAAGAIAAEGGIVCSLERMNTVIDLDLDNLTVTVEPGVITHELDATLQPHGLFFAGYPMSEEICTIGGNVATNAGGGRAVKYGVTAGHVLGLEVVLASGEVLHLGGKRLKDVTGLNLLPLFVGSEGILGIVTQITLRLTPRPNHRLAVLTGFATLEAATSAVSALRRASSGVPSSIEFIDGATARGAAAQVWRGTVPPVIIGEEVAALLLIEAEDRTGEDCTAALREYLAITAEAGAETLLTAGDRASLDQVWKLRKAVPWWVKRRAGEYHSVEDVVVPGGAISELVARARKLEAETGLEVAIFGHAGDGNFHINPMKPESLSPEEWDQALATFLQRLYRTTVDLGGTISGEHGIGRKRVSSLPIALSEAEIGAMRALKEALDPRGLLNPGVLLP